ANTGARVFGSRLEYNGYREHSVTENLLVQSKINWRGGDDSDLMVVIRKFHSPRAEDPGGLTAQQVTLNPRQAHSTNVLFDAGEEVDEETLGLRWRKPLAGRQEWTLSAQVIHRHFSNRLPFTPGGQVKFERWAPGASVKYINNRPWFKKSNRLVAGADVLFQNDDRERFNNHQGVRGATVLKQREIVDSQGIYLRNELLLFDDWELTAGGRYDRIHFRVNDSFFSDGNQSGSRTLSQGSGTLGLLYHITPNSSIYLNGATVFETPTSTELLNNPAGTGGFNPNLDPQTSYSVELGWKGRRVFEYELALFFIRTRDEITPFELAAFPGRTFFRNAGTSERQGVEGRIRWPMTAHWRGTLSYAYSDFEFRDFSVSGVSFAGNRIPGVPRHRVVGQIEYKNPQGWFARGQVERVHRFYVNNESTAQNSGYTASRLELGMEKTWGEMRGGLTFGMGNLLDERYNGNTRINAAGDRFFEPAPPFNLFGGISLSWVPGGQK
ncbi:MAG: TonB-dependent receptor, partial [Nitrospinaceae bacterium]|nr:TonB-dependent receptor [Nitrospinaceae bacterium]NIR54644.1 TonB-dependent receptor [Nitrospinaceae bacterium]NIS85061.1 TonB-dependent receptor [Nitrospinaceae bacterium]NIT81878.1 TonB-dependent receptor [Nitrospinaceae bacterium]NIU44142.1 TonB-dependent receptor [Nitrospinaceae bacterium]